MRRCWLIACTLALPAMLTAQAPEAPAATLSLEEALAQAKNHNPLFRQRLNNAATARMQLRNAYGGLLPNASVSGGMDYTGAGTASFGQGFTNATSATIGSSYSLGFSWQLDGARLLAPREQRANQRAVDEDIANEESSLKFSVTQQYLTALQAAAQVAVSRQQVERNQNFLDLASAKYRVGQGTLIEVRQAEVQKAQADVALLRSVQADNEAKIELFRRIGVQPPMTVERIGLSDSFPVVEPAFNLEDLLAQARAQNPALRALTARERSAAIGVTSAKTAFLPSLSVRAGWSGFTQQQTDEGLLVNQSLGGALASANACIAQDSIRTGAGLSPVGQAGCFQNAGLDATGTQLDPAVRRRILAANSTFPFDFTKQPFSIGLTISLPIFTGFGRSLRLQQAREFAQDADESVRGQALQVDADVHSRYLALATAYKAIGVQGASRDAARDQLRLAQDRYRLGSGTALEVSDAQNTVQRAEGDYVTAIYDYHKAIAALEAAVGRPLRP
ncbi:MAG TPA: TolC family protein [Gemmatimonadales bacterium]|nr:TolC family protein [Gemmatimonadales bacterium]